MTTPGTTEEALEPNCDLWSIPLPQAANTTQFSTAVPDANEVAPVRYRGRKRKVNVMLAQHYDLWLATLKMGQEIDDEVNLSPPTERKRLHRYVHPFPPILKSDIRRDYPTMIANAINSLNADLISGFFYQFGASSCYLENKMTITKPQPPLIGNTQGLSNIVRRIVDKICAFPDMVFSVKKAEILRHNYQAGSLLRLQINVSFTRLQK